MKRLKLLKFISVEGFWEKPIHDARVAEAAEKLIANPDAFAIATATHAPDSCVSFTKMALGKYSADRLINNYNIAPWRILPAYLFNQKTTYTIIDAYSNATMIGWLCSGLTKNKTNIAAELHPVTAGFTEQGGRILALNQRALQALTPLGIDTKILLESCMIMPFAEVQMRNPEEAGKLLKIKAPGEVIATGKWRGNSGIPRSFDDVNAMQNEILQAFQKVFGSNINHDILFQLSTFERVLLTLIWCTKANTNAINSSDWNSIINVLGNYFDDKLSVADIELAQNNLTNYGFRV